MRERLGFCLSAAATGSRRCAHRLVRRHVAWALERFAQLGAASWEREARAELARTGVRRPAPGELTASELRVAELAAAGLTNREVAQAAFMSPKTVEANLAPTASPCTLVHV